MGETGPERADVGAKPSRPDPRSSNGRRMASRAQDTPATALPPRSRPGAAAGFRLAAAAPMLPAVVAMACVAAYASQLGMGRWQTDEFLLFATQRTWGWGALVPRLAYAPRPFSEGVLFLYGEAVLRLGRPLITPFLVALWGGVLGAAALAARGVLPPSRGRLPAALALAATPFAFVLVTNPVTETFYWPVAAVAYLPTAGAALVLLFLLSRPLGPRRRLGCGGALLVAATSSEVGAALAIGFAGAALLEAASRPRGHPDARPRPAAALRDGAWWILPGLAGVAVMAAILSVRAGIVELGADAQPYTGRAAASITAALPRLAVELVAADGTPAAIPGALAARLLFALGFSSVWRQADRDGAAPGRWHAVLAASLAGAAFFSIAAAYYHYGALCCERQQATRSWLLDLLAILAMGWALARWRAARGGRRASRAAWLPPLLLALSLFPVLFRIEGLRRDYANGHFAADARARTWRSGLRAGTDAMEFFLPPDGPDLLVRGTALPIGTFRTGSDAPELATAVGRFFGKDVVNTCQPWQTERSWVVNGRFIPACPPRGGPPGVVPAHP